MTRPTTVTCSSCAFWDGHKNAASGQCRYNAPKPNEAGNWPDTRAEAWCGDWQNGDVYWDVQEIVIDDGLAEMLADEIDVSDPVEIR